MEIQAAEISDILKKQIKDFGTEAEVAEVGQVCRSVTVSPVSMAWTMCRLVSSSSSQAALKAWP